MLLLATFDATAIPYARRAVAHIERFETHLIDVPTIRGHVLSMATMRSQSVVLVRVRFSDGSEGWGEGTTIGGLTYGPESPEGIRLTIETYLAPLLVGRDGDDVSGAIYRMENAVKGNLIAKAAVETALWDGLGRRLGVPVAQLFGGAVTARLPVAWTLASGVSDTDIAEAREMIDAGRHNTFKLKIGTRAVADDVEHVARIRAALGDGPGIRVDVNQAWSLTAARRGVRALQDVGCDLVEQPLAARDLRGMAELTSGHEIAVMADEALGGPAAAQAVTVARAADVLAVKVGPSGGVRRAAETAAIGRAAGLGLYGGTMLETGLGTAAALQLFATLGPPDWGTEFFGPLLLAEEILTEPLTYTNFHVEVPQGAGLGVTPDFDKLAFYDRDRRKTVAAVAGE